jgi:threonine dehydrogenase-like Zn-dependent dehydrogenase
MQGAILYGPRDVRFEERDAPTIAMSSHGSRQKLAREFGATDIVTERGDEGVARIKELTNGIGADAVLECVGTHSRATASTRQRVRS